MEVSPAHFWRVRAHYEVAYRCCPVGVGPSWSRTLERRGPRFGSGAGSRGAGAAQVSGGLSTSPYPSLASCRTAVKDETYSKGVLTVATDDPVYAPWFVSNTPSNGKGYESAVAYDVGSLLGFEPQGPEVGHRAV